MSIAPSAILLRDPKGHDLYTAIEEVKDRIYNKLFEIGVCRVLPTALTTHVETTYFYPVEASSPIDDGVIHDVHAIDPRVKCTLRGCADTVCRSLPPCTFAVIVKFPHHLFGGKRARTSIFTGRSWLATSIYLFLVGLVGVAVFVLVSKLVQNARAPGK
jgi:hypothetical protein